jgi:hypothetical protein
MACALHPTRAARRHDLASLRRLADYLVTCPFGRVTQAADVRAVGKLPLIVHNGREVLEKRAMKEGLAFWATRHSIAGLLAESGAW